MQFSHLISSISIQRLVRWPVYESPRNFLAKNSCIHKTCVHYPSFEINAFVFENNLTHPFAYTRSILEACRLIVISIRALDSHRWCSVECILSVELPLKANVESDGLAFPQFWLFQDNNNRDMPRISSKTDKLWS